jgi:hypothetical protein
MTLGACGAPATKAPAPPALFRTPPTIVNGQVFNGRGGPNGGQTPLAGARISTSPGTAVAVSDSNGHFSLSSSAFRPDQPYRIGVAHPSFAPLFVEVSAFNIGQTNSLPELVMGPDDNTAIPEPPDLSDLPEESPVELPALDD